MKNWITFIFAVKPTLERLCEDIDKKVERIALYGAGRTLDEFNEILRLNDRKIALINLGVMYRVLLACLSDEERNVILMYSAGKSLEDIAESLYISRSSAHRKLCKAFDKCMRTLDRIGFDRGKMQKEYEGALGFFRKRGGRLKKELPAGCV